jgi:hypothetical protein
MKIEVGGGASVEMGKRIFVVPQSRGVVWMTHHHTPSLWGRAGKHSPFMSPQLDRSADSEEILSHLECQRFSH